MIQIQPSQRQEPLRNHALQEYKTFIVSLKVQRKRLQEPNVPFCADLLGKLKNVLEIGLNALSWEKPG